MTTLLTKIGDTGWPIIIASAIALIGVLVSAIISSAISRQSAYLGTVTAERSKWIEKLRSNIAELAGLCNYLHFKISTSEEYRSSKDHDEILKHIEHLAALIRLQLNPDGDIDNNIIDLVKYTPALATKKRDFKLFTADWLLVRHAQWLLKEEWETVKSEAAGLPVRCVIAFKRWRRAKAYQAFCEGEGSLKPLFDERPPS